jgi:chemotaxis protein CheD
VTAAAREIRVKVADHAIGSDSDVITTVGLGSCVAIVLHDAAARVGGLAHVLLPSEAVGRGLGSRAKYATPAVPLLLAELRAAGAGRAITAKIAGGASMFASLLPAGGVNMGERNVEATIQALALAGVPLVGRDTGGDYGRSITLDVRTGRVDVRSLRRGTLVL